MIDTLKVDGVVKCLIEHLEGMTDLNDAERMVAAQAVGSLYEKKMSAESVIALQTIYLTQAKRS